MNSGELVEELAEDLICPVCLEDFKQPKVLKCKHVFCRRCLEKLIDKKKLMCPICRTENQFEEDTGVSDLPEPLIIRKMQEKITKFLSASHETGPVSRTCGLCNDPKITASTFCLQCAKNLCENCTNSHKQRKVGRAHRLVPLSKRTICQVHTSELVNSYCQDCMTGTCLVCETESHTDHDVIDINDDALVKSQALKLAVYGKVLTSRTPIIDYHKAEVKEAVKDLTRLYGTAKQHLRELRHDLIDLLDDLDEELDQELAAELKKLSMYEEEITNMMLTRNSLLSYIAEVTESHAPHDIVLSANELPDISSNTITVLPKCKVPSIKHTRDDTVKFVRNTIDYKVSDVLNKLKHETPGVKKRRSSTNESSNVQPHYSATSDVQLRGLYPLRKGSRKKRWSAGEGYTPPSDWAWSTTLEECVYDVLGEPTGGWWVRTFGGFPDQLCRCDAGGAVVTRMGQGVLEGSGTLCMDTTRGYLVVITTNNCFVCVSTSGEMVRKITIPKGVLLCGVLYCRHVDMYVISDVGKHCLWFVNSDTGHVFDSMGTEGKGNKQFQYPQYICHQDISESECHLLVSDSDNHCIKVFSSSGDFIRKYGRKGSGDRHLEYPRGVCVDPRGGVVVCDGGNRRVVRYGCEGGEERWEVVRSPDQLGKEELHCVSVSRDGLHLVVGSTEDRKGVVRAYNYNT